MTLSMGAGQLIILIPIYKSKFAALEQFSIDYSLAKSSGRQHCFIAPEGLDCSYYHLRYPGVGYEFFPPHYFDSVQSYSRLLLSEGFYGRFVGFEFILMLQSDAIMLTDDLDFWLAQPFDYIGAPWPDGIELTVQRDRFCGENHRRVRTHVGNGGFSLRRVSKCLALIHEFPEMNAKFTEVGTNEDSYFSLLGMLSTDFIIPNEITASRFSMELKPEFYYAANGRRFPMGAHAWATVQPRFWAPCIPPLAAIL
jgi:hypothetical protein